MKCIYVAIGQKQSTIANVVRKLEEYGALAHTIIVAASASDSGGDAVSLRRTRAAPWASTSCDNGEDALIVYDDLSKQAWSPTGRSRCCCAVRRAVKPIPVTCSTCIPGCSSARRTCRNEEYVEKFDQRPRSRGGPVR